MKKRHVLLILFCFFMIDSIFKFFFNFGLIDSNLFTIDIDFMVSFLGN